VKPGRKPDFEAAALSVAGAIGSDDCRLVGGLAVSAYGYVRATKDVGFVARPALAEVKRRLSLNGIEAELHRGDVLEGDFPCLRGSAEGVPFDVLPPLVAVDWERGAVALEGQGTRLRVVPLDALLALKMKAQGPKDLMDATMLVLLHPEMRTTALELAQSYRVGDRFQMFLDDPRFAGEIEAIKRGQSGKEVKRRPSRRRR
jgi:hypothetical protein